MADIGPGQFPQTPSFQAINFRINTPTITSETTSGKIRRVGQGHSFYTFEVKYPSLTASQLGEVTGFVATAMGPMFSFEIVLPELSNSKAAAAATANNVCTVSQTVNPGDRYVVLSNCPTDTMILRAGDFFRFNTHSKVYMATQDIISGGAGTANLSFSGHAVTSVPAGTKLWLTNGVPFTVILDSPEQTFDVSYGGISTLSLSMREVW
jgi:hypothetical protein